MLQNFRFARYRFTYTVQEPLKMPRHKGNVFRGRLGYILRATTCVRGTQRCRNQCQFPQECAYSRCFETPVPQDSPILRGQPFAPHPFVLEPPRTEKRDYAPGDTFTCNLILIGEAIDLLPWLVLTFQEMGKRRIGLRNQRGTCRLDKVESLSALGNKLCKTIYTADTEMLTDEGLILRLDDVIEGIPHATDTIELEFLTPTSIKHAGRWTRILTFERLTRNLLRRIRFLSYCHCGQDLDVDPHRLIEAARSIRSEPQLQLVKMERRSKRTDRTVPMGGFVGTILFEGDLTPFIPFIRLGEYLHIGHHTAFGHGQYRLTSR